MTLVSMGPLEEWGPGQIALAAPPLGGPAQDHYDSHELLYLILYHEVLI